MQSAAAGEITIIFSIAAAPSAAPMMLNIDLCCAATLYSRKGAATSGMEMKMSYRSAWFSREQIHNIARTFSSIYNAKHGIGQDNDCNLALYLLDRGSRNRALAGAQGCNIEEKLINLGADRMRVRETLEMVNLYPNDFDTVSGY